MAGRTILLIAIVVTLGAARASLADAPAYLNKAIADDGRPAADIKRDVFYKPAEVIAFAGAKPGMKIADFMAGDGYYSRIFSRIVGPKGYVYAYYATQEDTPAVKRGGKIGAALAGYDNVGIVHGTAEQFVAPERLDLVWTALTYHDLHGPNFRGLDIGAVNKAVYDALKPGGIFIVLDRASRPGAGLRDLASLARIDEDTVKSEVEAAGFRFVSENGALHNPGDNLSKRVTKAEYEKRPDQFLLKFQKPRH
jgi:predicted methyltransferase